MRFRPCIDLHQGQVKQIVGGSLKDDDPDGPVTNFTTTRSPASYARLYRRDGLYGGHVIMLGPGNEEAALQALRAFPGGLQVGGGITPANAHLYLEAGASHVIVTSYVFRDARVDLARLKEMVRAVGEEHLVLDLSCRRREDGYCIVTDRWQRFTEVKVTQDSLGHLSSFCSEFLVHAVDVEGKLAGVEEPLVQLLGEYSPIAVTYAGGIASLADLDKVEKLGGGRVDATIGSALNIFGGHLRYREVVDWHKRRNPGNEAGQ